MEANAKTGCLLVHGYGGSPFEMEGLAAALAKAGFAVRNVCLPGHGEGYQGFRKSRFVDWLHHAENELRDFSARHERVVLAGFSMGGVLCLNLAARLPVAGVVTLSTPIYVMNVFPWPLIHERLYRAACAAAIRRFLNLPQPKKKPENEETSRDIAPWKGYDGPINIPQLWSFRAGCAETRRLLAQLRVPLLVMHDARDKLVYAGNALEIAGAAGSEHQEIVITRMRENITGHHMLPTHRETAGLVAARVTAFARGLS